FKIPAGEHDRAFFVLDPMLATGGSAVAAVGALKKAGAQRIRFLCLVAAPEGMRKMLAAHAEVPVYAAALDRQLNERGYILPGLGHRALDPAQVCRSGLGNRLWARRDHDPSRPYRT